MTLLRFLLTAKTPYNIHSPFLFDLCQTVIFAQLPQAVGGGRRRRRYLEMLYKMANHFQPTQIALPQGDVQARAVAAQACRAQIAETTDRHVQISAPGITLFLMERPHEDDGAEQQSLQLRQQHPDAQWVDLYHTLVGFCRHGLSPQYILLRKNI